jgi:predicted nucleic acid-binding protein
MSSAEIARALLELADALDRSGAPKARYKARGIRYDALYLLLAESLGAILITRDAALAAVPGTAVRVRVLA